MRAWSSICGPSCVEPRSLQVAQSHLVLVCLDSRGDSNELPSFFLGQKSAHLFFEGSGITISGSVDQRGVCHSSSTLLSECRSNPRHYANIGTVECQ